MLGCGYVSTSDYLNHIETITVTPVTVEDPDFTYERATGKLYDEVIREALVDRFSPVSYTHLTLPTNREV